MPGDVLGESGAGSNAKELTNHRRWFYDVIVGHEYRARKQTISGITYRCLWVFRVDSNFFYGIGHFS